MRNNNYFTGICSSSFLSLVQTAILVFISQKAFLPTQSSAKKVKSMLSLDIGEELFSSSVKYETLFHTLECMFEP